MAKQENRKIEKLGNQEIKNPKVEHLKNRETEASKDSKVGKLRRN